MRGRSLKKKVFDFFEKNSINSKETERVRNYPSGIIDSFKPYMQKNTGFSFNADSSLSSGDK